MVLQGDITYLQVVGNMMLLLYIFSFIGMRKGEGPKTPRHTSAAASRDDRLPHSRQKQRNIIATIKSVKYIKSKGISYGVYLN